MGKLPANITRRKLPSGRVVYQAEIRRSGRTDDGRTVTVRVRASFGEELAEARRALPTLRERAARDLEELQRRGGKGKDSWTYREFVERKWYPEHLDLRRNARGRQLARARHESYVLPVMGAVTLTDLRSDLYRAVFAFARSEGCSDQTCNHVLSDVRCALEYAETVGLISQVPSFRGAFAELDEAQPKPIPEPELARLIASAPGDWSNAIEFASITGLRLSEQRRIPESQILLDGNRPGLQVFGGRRRKRIRFVPLVPRAAELARSRIEENRASKRPHLTPWGFIPENPARTLHRLCTAAGVPYANWHRLRHTAASRAIDEGIPDDVIMAVFGWTNVSTLRRYARRSQVVLGRTFENIQANWALEVPTKVPTRA